MAKDLMTVANAPGVFGGGFMDWGRLSRAEIIKRTKEVAAGEVEKWGKVLATPDDAFDCRVVRGVHKQDLVERLMPLSD